MNSTTIRIVRRPMVAAAAPTRSSDRRAVSRSKLPAWMSPTTEMRLASAPTRNAAEASEHQNSTVRAVVSPRNDRHAKGGVYCGYEGDPAYPAPTPTGAPGNDVGGRSGGGGGIAGIGSHGARGQSCSAIGRSPPLGEGYAEAARWGLLP